MKITVNWGLYRDIKDDLNQMDLLIIDPIPALKYYEENNNADFSRCPAHINYLKNTYVVCCPIDLEILLDKVQPQCRVIVPHNLPRVMFNPRFGEERDWKHTTFSLGIMPFVFTCEDKDVIMEQIDPFLEWERSNNIRLVGGRYNIHRWTRALEMAYEQREKVTTIKFKRGDPMFYVRFFTDDDKDVVSLNRVDISLETLKDTQRSMAVKEVYKNKSLDFLYELTDKFKKALKK